MILTPVTITLTILGSIYNFLNHTSKSLNSLEKTVLITGARNTKCLFLARAFHREGCRVVVAEEPGWFHVNMTRFSNSVDSYHYLPDPEDFPEEYKSTILDIIARENVDLFLPCSSPSYTILDAEVALHNARDTTANACSSFIPHPALTSVLHWKHDFISLCSELGMVVPESILVSSVSQAAEFLHSQTTVRHDTQYITKCLAFDDLARTDMTPLPLASITQTANHLRKLPLPISERHTYVVQRLLHGPEYCTHAAVRDGDLVAFVTCRSSDMLMRYVDVKSHFAASLEQERRKEYAVGEQAEEWTRTFLQRWKAKLQRETKEGGSSFTTELTGHFCMDFILNEADGKLYPIECNPVCMSPLVPLVAIADCYLGSVLIRRLRFSPQYRTWLLTTSGLHPVSLVHRQLHLPNHGSHILYPSRLHSCFPEASHATFILLFHPPRAMCKRPIRRSRLSLNIPYLLMSSSSM